MKKLLSWENDGSCIRCTSHRIDDSTGYVRIQRRNRLGTIPRLILERRLGRVPDVARHTCDNHWCINPAHILDGTRADNSTDMVSRGRSAKGSSHGMARLSEAQAREVKDSASSNVELGKLFGVARRTIADIRNNKTWRHI